MSLLVDTAVISYRVADFLKHHPPFNAIDDADLLELAARGRVRFYEPNQYILWQGEPHRLQVFVIQQGTVSLWDESGPAARLRDVRGAGDMLGVERYNDAPNCLWSVRSESDVVIYAFPEYDFEACVMKHPAAAQYVAAEGRVTTDYQPTGQPQAPQRTFLHHLVGARTPDRCDPDTSIRDAARQILAGSSGALAVVDATRTRGVVTADALLRWLAHGDGDPQQSVETIVTTAPAVGPNTSVSDAVLAMEDAQASALAITSTGTPDGDLQAIVTAAELGRLFGEQPSTIVRAIRSARNTAELRALNRRARAFTLQYLSDAAAVEWLARLTHLVDVALVRRVMELAGVAQGGVCWCVSGAAGRAESLPGVLPQLIAIVANSDASVATIEDFSRVADLLRECDYMPDGEASSRRRFMSQRWPSGRPDIEAGFRIRCELRCTSREHFLTCDR